MINGDRYENRTRVTAVKGPCLSRLTNLPYYSYKYVDIQYKISVGITHMVEVVVDDVDITIRPHLVRIAVSISHRRANNSVGIAH